MIFKTNIFAETVNFRENETFIHGRVKYETFFLSKLLWRNFISEYHKYNDDEILSISPEKA